MTSKIVLSFCLIFLTATAFAHQRMVVLEDAYEEG